MNIVIRRVAAAVAAITLTGLVACDLWIGSFRLWWDRHSLTSSIVASLLVVAVTALIVDEVVARRQRREHAVSVAVQGLIVYGQARRAYDAVAATSQEPRSGGAHDELRTLASMLLTASPSLFDDPTARRFLEQVERFSLSMYRTVATSSTPVAPVPSDENRTLLASELTQLRVTVEPLLARIPPEDRSLLEGSASA